MRCISEEYKGMQVPMLLQPKLCLVNLEVRAEPLNVRRQVSTKVSETGD